MTVKKHIVILGGGITGLSSAFHLSRRFPNARITLVEKEDRLGGWIKSERVSVGSSSIVLEAGPRTLRPVDKAILELVSTPYLFFILTHIPLSLDSPLRPYTSSHYNTQILSSRQISISLRPRSRRFVTPSLQLMVSALSLVRITTIVVDTPSCRPQRTF
jgi:hypothetical protein